MPTTCDVSQCSRPAVTTREVSGTPLRLCNAHRMQLDRRRALTIARARDTVGAKLPWRVPEYLVSMARDAAERDGVEPGQWLESVLLEALSRDPE